MILSTACYHGSVLEREYLEGVKQKMKMTTKSKTYALAIALLVLIFSLVSCATVPYTGRSQLVLVSPQEEVALGQRAASQVLQQSQMSSNPTYINEVNTVGSRIAAVADQPGFRWQFHVLQDKDANAFALPGGKVFVNTGMFRYATDDAELATVIAHEVAHVIAHHGAERISRSMLTQLGGAVVAGALNVYSPGAQQAVSAAYGLATNVGVILPHSRSQEMEADQIGLILMAKAGYDPRVAIKFWQKMMRADKSSSVPAFLSTHPADQQRLSKIKAFMPEALRYYKGQS